MLPKKFVVAIIGSSFLSSMKPKNCAFHIFFNKASWCKKYDSMQMQRTFYIPPLRHLFYPHAFPCPSLSCVFVDGLHVQGRT